MYFFCYFNDLIWWCGWCGRYIGYSKQVSKGTIDSELLMKHGEIWTDWGESYWCLQSRYMSYFHEQILKRPWNRDNLAVECAKGIPLRRSGMTKHSNGNLEGRYPTWTNMDKFGWWSSVCTICTNPISSMVLGFQTWFLLACSTIRIWGAFFSFPLLHFLTLPLFLVAKKSWKNIPGFVSSSVQVVLRRWRALQLWWSAISVVYGWGEEISAWTSAAWLKALKGAVRFQETASVWCFFPWSLVLFTCFFSSKNHECDFHIPWQLLWMIPHRRMIPRFENAEQAAWCRPLVISCCQVWVAEYQQSSTIARNRITRLPWSILSVGILIHRQPINNNFKSMTKIWLS